MSQIQRFTLSRLSDAALTALGDGLDSRQGDFHVGAPFDQSIGNDFFLALRIPLR
jgi:hypothetical protein